MEQEKLTKKGKKITIYVSLAVISIIVATTFFVAPKLKAEYDRKKAYAICYKRANKAMNDGLFSNAIFYFERAIKLANPDEVEILRTSVKIAKDSLRASEIRQEQNKKLIEYKKLIANAEVSIYEQDTEYALRLLIAAREYVNDENRSALEKRIAEVNDMLWTIKDICGNKYNIVRIGEQYWMAENLRCNRYDTNSGAYKTLKEVHPFPEKDGDNTIPYFTNATNLKLWTENSVESGVNVNKNQISKFGYFYNWAAAVGVENGYDRTTSFANHHQGICPNGWHLPSEKEWEMFYRYIKNGDFNDYGGTKIKSNSGWFEDGNGNDTYGFNALPAGFAMGNSIESVGRLATFWSATPLQHDIKQAASVSCTHSSEGFLISSLLFSYKFIGRNVRCLRD